MFKREAWWNATDSLEQRLANYPLRVRVSRHVEYTQAFDFLYEPDSAVGGRILKGKDL